MVYFYVGNLLSGISDKALKFAAERDKEKKNIIIVPDRFTLCSELSYTAMVGGTVNGEITTFSRFAESVLHDKIHKCLTPEGAVMLMTRGIQNCKSDLNCYGNAVKTSGFASELFAGISAIRASGVSHQDLQACGEKLRGYPKNKTLDIALIYKNYLSLLSENYNDSTSRLEAFRDSIGEETTFNDSPLSDYDVYITDFYTFTEVQYGIIEKLMRYCKNVTLPIIKVEGEGNSRIFPSEVAKRLRGLATSAEVKAVDVSAFTPLNNAGEMIEKHVFGYDGVKSTSPCNDIELYKAIDDEEEVSLVASEILRLVRRENYRFKEIALVLTDCESYRPVIRRVFRRFGIPYFTDERELLGSQPLVFSVFAWLNVFLERFSLPSICEFIKTPFSGISSRDAHIFENYCLKYAIKYSFKKPFDKKFDSQSESERQEVAEKVRKEILSFFEDSELFQGQKMRTAEEYGKIIIDFLKNHDYENRLSLLYDNQQKEGYVEESARLLQIPQKFFALINNASSLLKDTPLSLKDYRDILKNGADSGKIALIPQVSDCVYIGEGEDSRYDDVKALFILGATDGNFPKVSGDEGILTDRDYSLWEKYAIKISPTNKEQRKFGRFYAEQLLLCPTNKLYLSYACKNGKGDKVNPSIIIERLSSIFSLPLQNASTLLSTSVEFGGKYTIGELVGTPEGGCKRVIDGIRNMRRGYPLGEEIPAIYNALPQNYKDRIEGILNPGSQAPQDAKALFFGSDTTSVSQLESYFSCPFRHFISYGLRAKDRETGELEKRDAGNFIHLLLEKYFSQNDVKSLSDDDVERIGKELVEQCLEEPLYAALFENNQQKGRLSTLKSECMEVLHALTTLAKRSDFKPVGFEVGFGNKREYQGLALKGKVTLSGKIDRIDELNNQVVVIDYKTGSLTPELKQVYYGKKVQLYVYLQALKNHGKKPVAAFYQPIKANYTKEGDADYRYRFQGQLLNEAGVISSLDKDLEPGEKSPVIPVTYSKKGKTANKTASLLTEEEFTGVMDYVTALCNQAVTEIQGGNYTPSPLKESCKYCSAKNICGYNVDIDGYRKTKKVSKDSF